MSRSIFCAIILCLSASSATAEASNPLIGKAEKLVFVSETQFPGKNGNQALCTRVVDQHFLYVPWQRTVVDYVFANNRCTDPHIHAIPEGRVALFKSAGILPSHVPTQPTAPTLLNERTIAMLLLAALAVVGVPLFLRRRMRIAKRQSLQTSNDPMFYDILLSLLFHTAKSDGAIDKSELQAIMRTYKDLTGSKVTPEMTAEKFGMTLQDDVMLNLVKKYRGNEASVLMDSAIRIATHCGTLSRERRCFLTLLNSAMDGNFEELSQRIDDALGVKPPPRQTEMQTA